MSRLELDVTEWRRVSPKYVWVDLVGMLIAAVICRSLNEPVGFAPSYFNHTSQPTSSLRTQA